MATKGKSAKTVQGRPQPLILKRKMKKHWTVSEICAAEYCEQKVVLDRKHGDRPLPHVLKMRKEGDKDHQKFEQQGHAAAKGQDKRCFVATAVFGQDAPQTEYLRQWRDRVLMSSFVGRQAVRVYYRLSPALVKLTSFVPGSKAAMRWLLSRIISVIGG